jgi:hypothetical protein
VVRESIKYFKSEIRRNDGFGLQEVLGIAAVLIVASFVIIPGFRTFAGTILTALTNWFTTTVQTRLFPTT